MWEKEFTPEWCQDVIDRAGNDFEEAQFFSGDLSGASELNTKFRRTNIHWNSDQDLFDIAFHYMKVANKSGGWNFQVDVAEDFQIGQYPKGGHYDWHVDGLGIDPINAPNNKLLHGRTRKISMVVWLNEGFQGGGFQFHEVYQGKNVINLIKPKQGTIIMFPSWMMHRVTPVKKGIRYSMVSWFLGRPVQ
jgi:PKHD-type hydroxylase